MYKNNTIVGNLQQAYFSAQQVLIVQFLKFYRTNDAAVSTRTGIPSIRTDTNAVKISWLISEIACKKSFSNNCIYVKITKDFKSGKLKNGRKSVSWGKNHLVPNVSNCSNCKYHHKNKNYSLVISTKKLLKEPHLVNNAP